MTEKNTSERYTAFIDKGSKKREREKQKKDRIKWKEDNLIKKMKLPHEKNNIDQIENLKENSNKETSNKDINKDRGRHYTVSIAVPASILDNAQSPELKTYLIGQIARALVIFNVDEVVIFDDTCSLNRDGAVLDEVLNKKGTSCLQMLHVLQYLECPQYLRKTFFPKHHFLKFAGLLNPLDSPHHMRQEDRSPYREGVVMAKPVKTGHGSFVNVGALADAQIAQKLLAGTRVTVRMEYGEAAGERNKLKGEAVSCCEPREEAGLYWGYRTRLAGSLAAVFRDPPSVGGAYDCLIGTSEKGKDVDEFGLPKFEHLLVVFGGLSGLEVALDADQSLEVDDPSQLFQYYINTCPGQGSRTIRTEEAILITLAALRPKINNLFPPKNNNNIFPKNNNIFPKNK